MSVLPIVRWPDPRLSRRCDPVGRVTDEIRELASDMLETMYAAPGRGLAAPQVGVLSRLFVMDVAWKTSDPDPMVFVDPDITWQSELRVTGPEGCLSIPGVTADIERAAELELAWTGLDGQRRTRRFDGFAAICIQHEFDHLEGLVTFDRVDPAHRARLEAEYSGAIA